MLIDQINDKQVKYLNLRKQECSQSWFFY